MAIDWKLYEQDVNRWYLDEGKTANEVIHLLHEKHNLRVTTRQFKVKFGGCKKISSKEWSILIPKLREREANHLKSVVYVCGKAVKQESVTRSMRRYSKLCRSGSQSNTTIDLGIDTIGQHRIEIRTSPQSGSGLPSNEITAETQPSHQEEDTSRLQNDEPDIDEEFGLADMDIELNTALCLSPSTFLGGLGQLAPNPSKMLSFGDTSERLMESDEAMLSTYQWPIRSPSSGPASLFPFRHNFISFWESPGIRCLTLECCQVLGTARGLGIFIPDHGQNELLPKLNISTAQTEVLTPIIQSIKELLMPQKGPYSSFKAESAAQLHFPPNLLDIADRQSLAQALSVTVYMVSNNLLDEEESFRLICWISKRGHAPELLAFSQLPAVNHLAFGFAILRAISKTESRLTRRQAEAVALIGDFVSSREFLSLVKSHREDLLAPLGMMLLRLALKTDSMELAKLLLSHGIDLKSDSESPGDLDHTGLTLLDIAVRWRRHSMLELIIGHGVDVNQNCAEGLDHPIGVALRNDDHSTVQTLLNTGALIPDGILFGSRRYRKSDTHALLRKSLRHDPEFVYWELVMAAEMGNRELSKVSLAHDIVSPQVLERAFCRAVEEGNLEAIGTFLRRGTDPNVGMAAFQRKIDSFKQRPSLQADIIYLLVQAGARFTDEIALSVQHSFTLEVRDPEDDIRLLRVLLQLGHNKAWIRQRLLTSYAKEGSMFDCDACIDGGALINGHDINGESALQTAARNDSLFLVQHLISRGADPNLPPSSNHPNGETALYSALALDNREMAAYLIDSGADITAKAATRGATLLEGALVGSFRSYNLQTSQATTPKTHFRNLLALGAPVHRSNGTDSFLLHGLLYLGKLDCLELALKAGAQAEGKYGGMTPIQLAVLQKDTDSMQSLLQHGANINGYPGSPCSHTTLLEMSSPSPSQSYTADRYEEALKGRLFHTVFSSGFRMGVFADKKPYFPHSPLQLASSYHHPDLSIVEFLLSQGADFNAPAAEWYGRTALQGAASAEKASMEVIKLLLDRGADVNEPPAQVGGVTALQGAAIRGDIQLVRFLLEKKADPNAPGSPIEGRTALEGAAEHGRIEMLRFLLSKEAMPDPVTGYSRAIELAEKELHLGIANFLREEQRKLGEIGFLGIDLDSP